MGCGSSAPAHQPVSHHKPRPQASVRPQQQQQPVAAYNPQQTEIAVKDIKTTKELLQQYIDIDNKVRAYEAKYTLKKYTEMHTEHAALQETCVKLEKAYREAQEKTAKEKGEYEDLFSVWSKSIGGNQEEESDPNVMKEKKEWIEAKGEEEVAKAELEAVKVKLAKSETTLRESEPFFEELKAKHKEQEELLAAIFKGKYGSDHENKLEAEFDFLDDRKQRVGAARYKWTNGKNLLSHATSQLCVACKKWMMLPTMNPADQQGRYVVATEARNNIVAAAQNITSAKRYLNTIEFPYCKPAEVAVLEKAAAHVYTDMQSHQRHQYVYANVYHSMYLRCKELVKWFAHVLTETISEDLKDATTAANAKAQELRQERLNLISVKVKEELQQEVTFEAHTEDLGEEENAEQVFEAEGAAGEDTSEEEPPSTEIEADQPFNPVPLKELVQAPNKEDLFGDAQELYKRHQENLEELEKNQMVNKARQEQGLEEKLKARRSKRQRQAAIAVEEQANS
ncbi:axoneme-associated protein mst101(2)-like isoform X2 [Watersipora subatra]|uniref:axoneme-associated protein mst101(2)-like isoform X2 n=1 Tax=Watersipora subatra TaxID=2589382 RepID=UPI00355C522F